MIVPDINLLLYAYDPGSPFHSAARTWWEGLSSGSERVGVPWIVTVGFVRIMTNPAIAGRRVPVEEALSLVDGWFSNTHITELNPGAGHLAHFRQALQSVGGGRNRVTDAHLAALAIEYDAELHTNDADFRRFPGLRWQNPLQ